MFSTPWRTTPNICCWRHTRRAVPLHFIPKGVKFSRFNAKDYIYCTFYFLVFKNPACVTEMTSMRYVRRRVRHKAILRHNEHWERCGEGAAGQQDMGTRTHARTHARTPARTTARAHSMHQRVCRVRRQSRPQRVH